MTSSLHVHSERYHICGRLPSSLLPAGVLPGEIGTSAQKGFYRSPSFFFCSRGLGCHEVSHNFRKQRCIGENVEGGHGQSLALLHGTVVSV